VVKSSMPQILFIKLVLSLDIARENLDPDEEVIMADIRLSTL